MKVPMAGGFVIYCKHFKYLGPWVTYNLRDDHDIEMRILSANKAMDKLKSFFNRAEVAIISKYLIFIAIPINLLLYVAK